MITFIYSVYLFLNSSLQNPLFFNRLIFFWFEGGVFTDIKSLGIEFIKDFTIKNAALKIE